MEAKLKELFGEGMRETGTQASEKNRRVRSFETQHYAHKNKFEVPWSKLLVLGQTHGKINYFMDT